MNERNGRRDDYNLLTSVQVQLLNQKPVDFQSKLMESIYGKKTPMDAVLKFYSLLDAPDGVTLQALSSMTADATVTLEPVSVGRANAVAGQIFVYATIKAVKWDKNGTAPADVLPKKIDDLSSVNLDQINLYDGSAIGVGTMLRFIMDVNQCAAADEITGWVDLVGAFGALTMDEAGFAAIIPPGVGMKSESLMAPYGGNLEYLEDQVDFTKVGDQKIDLVLQLLKAQGLDKDVGKYTTLARQALKANPLCADDQDEEESNDDDHQFIPQPGEQDQLPHPEDGDK